MSDSEVQPETVGLMVLSPDYRDYLVRLLEQEEARERAALPAHCVYAELRATAAKHAVRSASVIHLPGLHTFRDEDGDEYQCVAWSKEDAKRQIRADGRSRGELTWNFTCCAWPNMGVSRLVSWSEEEG